MVFCAEVLLVARAFGKLFYPLSFIMAIYLYLFSLSVLSQYELICLVGVLLCLSLISLK